MAESAKSTYSLQRLFMKRLMVIIVPFAVAMLWGAYLMTLHYANKAFDRSLARRAYALADQVEVVKGKVVFDLPQQAHSVLEFDPTDIFYFRVIGPNGEHLAGATDLGAPASVRHLGAGQLRFFDTRIDDERVRGAAYSLSLKGTQARGRVMILAAETTAKRTGLADEILLAVFLPMIAVVLLLVYAIGVGVNMSLRPIQAIREAIARRGTSDLEPIEIHGLPVEIEPLLVEMNRLVADLRSMHDSRQRFLEDSAHQLRTPLASMRAQTELLMRTVSDKDSVEVLGGLLSSLDRQSRLVNQLLALSRVENVLTNTSLVEIRLDELARHIAAEWAPRALERNIDLEFDPPPGAVRVLGDAHALAEALANLLDNALRYCRSGDRVSVRVFSQGDKACLAVSDTGPGVPEPALERLFERFYRVPGAASQGCGLGLAIVREVVMAHGGEAAAANGKDGGLEILLSIPRAP